MHYFTYKCSVCTLSVWLNVYMVLFFHCFGLHWEQIFGDYHAYECLTCFDHWLCALHTLPHECFVMHCSCISHAHHNHTKCTHFITWHVLYSLMLCKSFSTFSSYNMFLWLCLRVYFHFRTIFPNLFVFMD